MKTLSVIILTIAFALPAYTPAVGIEAEEARILVDDEAFTLETRNAEIVRHGTELRRQNVTYKIPSHILKIMCLDLWNKIMDHLEAAENAEENMEAKAKQYLQCLDDDSTSSICEHKQSLMVFWRGRLTESQQLAAKKKAKYKQLGCGTFNAACEKIQKKIYAAEAQIIELKKTCNASSTSASCHSEIKGLENALAKLYLQYSTCLYSQQTVVPSLQK
jgi:hypothetical protein